MELGGVSEDSRNITVRKGYKKQIWMGKGKGNTVTKPALDGGKTVTRLEEDWEKTGKRLGKDWDKTGTRLRQDRDKTGTRLGQDWDKTGTRPGHDSAMIGIRQGTYPYTSPPILILESVTTGSWNLKYSDKSCSIPWKALDHPRRLSMQHLYLKSTLLL